MLDQPPYNDGNDISVFILKVKVKVVPMYVRNVSSEMEL